MKQFISVLLLAIVFQWICIADLVAQTTPPPAPAATTSYLVENYSSLSPIHAYSLAPANVQIFITGQEVDHYRITLNYVDMQGAAQRLVSYCDWASSYKGLFQPTLCVMEVDAAVITSVHVEPFSATALRSAEANKQ